MSLNEQYLSAYPGYFEFIRDMPIWAKAAWGLGAIGSVLGCIFLLVRKAWAVPQFAVVILGMFASFGYQFMAGNKPEMTTAITAFTAVIWVVAFFLLWFASKAKNKGWLT